ncbi:MAG: aminotransferase class IV [Planctomycetaceae bacterium]|nr:aminotransferase class IV [Planctomycetaceae bacterium]
MIAYFNGAYIDPNELKLTPWDSGFMLGATIAEQLRTFAGRPFQVTHHLDRMEIGIEAVGLTDQVSRDQLEKAISHVAKQNHSELGHKSDLGITVFVTPGIYPTYAPNTAPIPSIAVHTYELPFQFWAHKYEQGQRLVVVDVQQISPRSWSNEIKCRSRMHYFLAGRQARNMDASADALLLDENGYISETPIANIVLHLPDEGFVSPPKSRILPGVSLDFLQTLAKRKGIPFHFRDVPLSDFQQADEVLLTSTPYCLLPVNQVDGHGFRRSMPGRLFQSLCQDWMTEVDCDFVAQASAYRRQ